MRPIIGFCGMGHLGIHSRAAAHTKGFDTVTYEFGKTGDLAEDLRTCDVVYICPDRPNHHVLPEVLVDIALKHMKPDAVLVVLCQVEPGFTRKIQWPKVYYQVETLKVNDDAMERALNPERIIIGRKDNHAIIKPLFEFLLAFNCPVISMSYESAELAKIAINVYLAAQVCTTNTLSEVATKIGANWGDIIKALQSDKRIGYEAYLKPGSGCGPHLERDLKLINEYKGIHTAVTEAFLEYSEILGHTLK